MGKMYKIVILALLVLMTVPAMATVYADSETYIEIVYGTQKFVYRDSYIAPSNHLVAEEIFERKINAPLAVKLDFVKSKMRGGADCKTAMLTCFPRLEETVNEVTRTIEKSPIDSEIRFDPYAKPMFTISRDKRGVTVLEERLYREIYIALLASPHAKVTVPVEHPKASVTTADNIALTNLRAKYSTDFSSSTEERKHNISLALSKINGFVLGAGENMSFNNLVGGRTSKNGFLESKIIKGGKYVPGIGGGVCQASTTLYNAALMSDLTILKVSRHSLQSSYELPSFDAMVNSGSSDLVIANDGARPVFIKAYTTSTRAFVEIYGTKLPYTIKRKSEVTFTGETPGYDEVVDTLYEHFDAEAEPGAKKVISYSHPEVHSNGYLLYYEGDRLVRTSHIRSDVYNSTRGVIAVAPEK